MQTRGCTALIFSSAPRAMVREEVHRVEKNEWVLCPHCGNKTRTMVRTDTVLKNFPLYCPKCKQETLVNVQKLNTSVIIEPDALT